ncbi:VCBS repeat-containing protein [Ferribacterium limneticum]|uniref:VCBS repeat-containing protein n=1 Tax=Ferribacterium limneticum TaxID=76259 RepID=UPI001CF984AF|nr:VCBS repeat-containing protein [Ferribacterium limneticum]UCV19046.1 VCBS repeat-containing protein [Ferribacterium limneticum]
MKIQDSNVQLSSTHEASRSQALEVSSERQFRRIFDDLSLSPAEARKSERQEIQKMLQSLLDAIMAAMDGKKVGEKFAAGEALSAQPAVARRGAEISWQRTIRETVTESEKTTVCGNGKVTTCDGKVIEFDYALAMERNYTSEKVEEESGTVKLSDPLMLSFNGMACELTEDCISFDLNADGTAEQIPGIGKGSGYLVLDRNGNGKADDGSELFGVASGNGFADLAKLDDDHNGWIDEADAAFSQLGVWSGDGFGSLKQQGVGALCTATVNAEFSLKTKSNELLGQIRAAGLYLSEAGEVGHMQQVDLIVSDLPAGSEHPEQGEKLAA